ncbi:Maf-like protein [Saliniradius amylolyticus]|uniref:7-methyl-GTP pyrophosphatase n=1 Tax=Saliniradius amylolyticus TaxID=2183582 RepID=A0A2S2E453_9ALTE|nr:Maf family nucleotide pyrophosphatase [Saliniradius amylolyticus]AWL12030.1 Maf-like protein [Saliniradius amylolyticus]
MELILASSSPFRQSLLNKLGITFRCQSPDIDESPVAGESPQALVERLARQKAETIAANAPHSLVIGSDQVAVIDDQIMGKPGERDKALAQLRLANGKRVHFYTGLCLLNSNSGNCQTAVEPVEVVFRRLTEQQLTAYIDKETPFQCAGSFKCEGLGISLFSAIHSDDPNTLVGLPLIRLTQMLANEGVDVLTA